MTFIFSILCSVLCAQTDAAAVHPGVQQGYQQLDTLPMYNVSLLLESAGKSVKYWVNGERVDAATYGKYKKVWENIHQCTPCYTKLYDVNDRLIGEGPCYTDCRIGKWMDYYPDGSIKQVSFYKENPTGNWEDAWNRGYCSRPHGEWIYYRRNGTIEKTEQYEDGKLME